MYTSIKTVKELKQLTEHVYNNNIKRIGLDTETDGLDTTTCNLLGVSISTEEESGYWIPLDKNSMSNLDSYQPSLFDLDHNISLDNLLEYLNPILADSSIIKFVHNIKFDIPLLERFGFTINNFFCTYLGAWVLGNVKHRKFGLKSLAKSKFDVEMLQFKPLVKRYGNFQSIPVDVQTVYAGPDADIALRLGNEEYDLIMGQHNSLLPTYEMEHELAFVLLKNERHGVLVDKEKLIQRSEDLDKEIEDHEKEFYKFVPKSVQLTSNKQLLDYARSEVAKLDSSDQVSSVSEESLLVLEDIYEFEWIQSLLEHRAASKTKSTFVDGILERLRPDGRLETSFQQAGIATGRLSSRDPNLQNIPKKYRDIFIVPDEFYMVAIDFSGMELRLLADLANEEKMLQAFKEGKDVHSMNAALVFDLTYENIIEKGKGCYERKAAKTIGFGLVYGMSEYKLSRTLGISVKEARQLMDKFFRAFPGIKNFMDNTIRFMYKNGYVENAYGRRRYFPINKYRKNEKMLQAFEREAGNYPIQSLNAEITKRALIQCERKLEKKRRVGYKTHQLVSIHDEIIGEFHKNEVDELVPMYTDIMENIYQLKIPTIAEVGIGYNMFEACIDEENWKLYKEGKWS